VAGGRWQVAGGRWQVAGGRWQTVISRPVLVANWASWGFHNLSLEPLDPPPSAVISSFLASG